MSHQSRKSNGRFVKKKKLDSELTRAKILLTARKVKAEKMCMTQAVENDNICTGYRFVDMQVLAKNLKCCKCTRVLSLQNIVTERRLGLHSILTIACEECKIQTIVSTGKTEMYNGHKYAESNLSLVLGAIHSGVGYTGLKKLLACMDIPGISNDLYKRYKKVVRELIETTAKDSCKKATEEEHRLMIRNMKKL
ncbi:PREDICTED: uncharacterized protein LOC108783589 [Cyphomyrmex costatus]|uniref:uncharacterized protein LOC108783589 n=1 Tax=Cyphomyrmex costatus TaxID=456900 RepID=UPI00085220AD|nr:PREDICTED: uncharacterized protein LOC108783589 [Cyphomyrmex costatus]